MSDILFFNSACARHPNASLTYAIGPTSFITPLHTAGAVVDGVSLATESNLATIQALHVALVRYGALILHRQELTPERQAEITEQWFGHELVRQYGKRVTYLSNTADQGLTKIGDSGFHLDYQWGPRIYHAILLHALNVSQGGDTLFVRMDRLVDALARDHEALLDDLQYMSTVKHESHTQRCVVLANHPESGRPALIVHLGTKGGRLVRDRPSPGSKMLTAEEQVRITDTLNAVLYRPDLLMRHQWQVGDVVWIDNWGVLHKAANETQWPVEVVGLRRMQRSCTMGLVHQEEQAIVPTS